MFANDQSRYKILVAVVVLAVIYTSVDGLSNLKELARLSDASAKNLITIANHRARIAGHRSTLSTVSNAVVSNAVVGHVRPARQATDDENPGSLVESCAFVLTVFNAHQVHCVGTEKCGSSVTDQSVGGHRYQVKLQGDFQSVLRAMEEIEADRPNSWVVSCLMDVGDLALGCKWAVVFEFTESPL